MACRRNYWYCADVEEKKRGDGGQQNGRGGRQCAAGIMATRRSGTLAKLWITEEKNYDVDS